MTNGFVFACCKQEYTYTQHDICPQKRLIYFLNFMPTKITHHKSLQTFWFSIIE